MVCELYSIFRVSCTFWQTMMDRGVGRGLIEQFFQQIRTTNKVAPLLSNPRWLRGWRYCRDPIGDLVFPFLSIILDSRSNGKPGKKSDFLIGFFSRYFRLYFSTNFSIIFTWFLRDFFELFSADFWSIFWTYFQLIFKRFYLINFQLIFSWIILVN